MRTKSRSMDVIHQLKESKQNTIFEPCASQVFNFDCEFSMSCNLVSVECQVVLIFFSFCVFNALKTFLC